MADSNEPDQGVPVTPDGGRMPMTNIWLHLYSAAITGLVSQDADRTCGPSGYAADAADIADEAARLIAKRQELLRLAKKVVDQPEPDDS